MDKRGALIIALSVTFLVIGNYIFFSQQTSTGREQAAVERVLDGDTLELEDGRTVRLLNINTPEKGQVGAEEARAFLALLENKSVELEVTGIERYGRTLARVYASEYVNLKIVRTGLGQSFLVSDEEKDDFRKAQKSAFDEGLGVWKRSSWYGCLSAEINKNEEYVVLDNDCDRTLKEWTIKDESTHDYKFKDVSVKRITLYSGEGQDNESSFYWGRGNIWNNDRDSLFIRDENEELVFYTQYGY